MTFFVLFVVSSDARGNVNEIRLLGWCCLFLFFCPRVVLFEVTGTCFATSGERAGLVLSYTRIMMCLHIFLPLRYSHGSNGLDMFACKGQRGRGVNKQTLPVFLEALRWRSLRCAVTVTDHKGFQLSWFRVIPYPHEAIAITFEARLRWLGREGRQTACPPQGLHIYG